MSIACMTISFAVLRAAMQEGFGLHTGRIRIETVKFHLRDYRAGVDGLVVMTWAFQAICEASLQPGFESRSTHINYQQFDIVLEKKIKLWSFASTKCNGLELRDHSIGG
jgi:hypothetical protein